MTLVLIVSTFIPAASTKSAISLPNLNSVRRAFSYCVRTKYNRCGAYIPVDEHFGSSNITVHNVALVEVREPGYDLLRVHPSRLKDGGLSLNSLK